jgi:hypothetical protein
MNTYQILSIIHGEPSLKSSCLGVYAADDLPKILPIGKSLICNVDLKLQRGSHWLAMLRSSPRCVEFFDSFGRKPENYWPFWKKYLEQFATTVLYNPYSLQQTGSDVCGFYCICFLLFRLKGWSFSEILNSLFQHKPCENDIFVELFVENFVDEDILPGFPAYVQTCTPK